MAARRVRTPSRELDSRELSERLRRITGAESVELESRLQALWGGYGELWRAELTRGGTCTSVIVKHVRPPPDDGSRSHRRKLRSYAVEQAFYERYARHCADTLPCRIPSPIALHRDADAWLFVLEDLDRAGFGERRARAGASQIRATLRWLANFHAQFLGTAPEGLWKVGTYWHLATRPEELQNMRHPVLRTAASRIDAALSSARFKTFVHGDAKLENICVSRAGDSVALVDFQYVGGGVGVKDVAYFLGSCLEPSECAARVPLHLTEYFAELRAALETRAEPVDCAELEHEWRALFPLAWVDFYRFLVGWAPGSYDPDPYSERLLTELTKTM